MQFVQAPEQPRTILGIDPGTNLLGYSVIRTRQRKAELVAMGVIDLRNCKDTYTKLGRIYERIKGIIDSFQPDDLAIEAPFFGKNVQSMLKLGRAQGVAIAAAISRNIPIHEYAPLKIKMAITGNGQASKEQVAAMLCRIFSIRPDAMPPYLDASDALGVAYCHLLQSQLLPTGSSSTTRHTSSRSWSDFVKQNPDRLSTSAKTNPDRLSTSTKTTRTGLHKL